jgi:hypothetical protein
MRKPRQKLGFKERDRIAGTLVVDPKNLLIGAEEAAKYADSLNEDRNSPGQPDLSRNPETWARKLGRENAGLGKVTWVQSSFPVDFYHPETGDVTPFNKTEYSSLEPNAMPILSRQRFQAGVELCDQKRRQHLGTTGAESGRLPPKEGKRPRGRPKK